MENEIYEKDYGEEFRERSDKSEGKDFLDTLMEVGFFQKYQEEMNKIPKRVVPKEKADYEYLLGECDAYVRQFGEESGARWIIRNGRRPLICTWSILSSVTGRR